MKDPMAAFRRGKAVMGILNVTPDSFSDGGLWARPEDAAGRAFRMEDEGADIIDIGAESTRPGSVPVSGSDEAARLVPALREIVPSLSIPVSVDTMKTEVAEKAIGLGADMINDVYGLRGEGMAELCAGSGVSVVIMHAPGDPGNFHSEIMGQNFMEEIRSFLSGRARAAEEAGIKSGRIVLDPGIGFGKDAYQNQVILRSSGFFSEKYPVLAASSRKRFLSVMYPGTDPDEASARAALVSVIHGAAGVRVHNVGRTADLLRLAGRRRR